jgi:eukaryotic-like serine/threonine-protein kinase
MPPEAGQAVDRAAAVPIIFGPFVFDPRNGILSRDGAEIPLPPRVIGVLALLVSRPGEVVSRQDLLEQVWKDAFVTDTSLAEAVSFLRQALADDPQSPRYIQTVHRRGYRFVAPVRVADPVVPAVQPGEPPAHEVVKPSIGRDLAPWSVAAFALVLAMTALWHIVREQPPESFPVIRFEFRPSVGSWFDQRAPALAASPDGQRIAWVACEGATDTCGISVRALDRLESARLAGTDGAQSPFFSPDSRWIGFFADGKLKKVALSGGAPVTLADAPVAGGASWGSDGRIVFAGAPAGGLSLASDQGGEVNALTAPRMDRGELRHLYPSWLPDGTGILFTIASSPVAGAPGEIAVMPVASKTWQILRSGVSRAVPGGVGYVLLSNGADLQAATFDPRTRTLTGAPDSVFDALATTAGTGQFAVSGAGTLVAVRAPLAPKSVWWADDPNPRLARLATLAQIALSPDARRAAGVLVDTAGSDIWTADLESGALSRVTYGGINVSPVWSADGTRLLYATRTSGPFTVMARGVTGIAAPQTIAAAPAHLFPGSLARDGRIAVVQALPTGHVAIGVVSPPAREPRLFNDGPFDEMSPAFSPDGRWLAFESNETGRMEVYVRGLPEGRRYALSTGGGERPSWSADGRFVYFEAARRVMRVVFSADREPHGGDAEIVFDQPAARVLAVGPTGRVLVERQAVALDSGIVVLQWLREMRQRLPAPVTAPR